MRTIIAVSFVMIPIHPIQILSQTADILKSEQLLGERFAAKSNPGKLIRIALN
jgi:hypothetical protein